MESAPILFFDLDSGIGLGAQRLAASLESAHPRRSATAIRGHSAQRLAASLESAHRRLVAGMALPSSAQRLAASLESARGTRFDHRAHRRQCSTPGGVIGIGTIRSVESSSTSRMCSTPGGVIGIGTPAADRATWQRSVLNAWRRHWNRHARPATGDGVFLRGAQRLAASLESAQTNTVTDEWQHPYVLNAWRRHWNRHGL